MTKKIEKIEKVDNLWPTYKRLLGYIRPFWWAIAIALVASVLSSGVDALLTFLLKPLLDEGFVARNHAVIKMLPFIIMGIFALRGAATFVYTYLLAWAARHIIMQFRQKVFAHLLSLPTHFFDRSKTGQLLSKLTYNIEQIAKVSTDVIATVVRETALIIFLLCVIVTISWQLSLLIFGILPIMIGSVVLVSRKFRRHGRRIQETMGDAAHIAEESFDANKIVKIFGGNDYETSRFNEATRVNRKQEMRIVRAAAINVPLVQCIAALALAVTVYFATSGTAIGGLTAGEFTSMVVAMFALLRPIKQLTSINHKIQQGLVGAQSVFELLDEVPEIDHGTQTLACAKGAIEYQNVSLAYTRDKGNVLEDINFSIAPGECVAFVGKSGSGKTSLVNLLPRFYLRTSGLITLDGVDINDIKLGDLRKQFSFVSQGVNLFNDTIANNIAYGRLGETTEADIIKAAESAYAMEFISQLPEGIHTQVGSNGVLLSGGQRQRIAIARAILKDAPILILDEATSALDTESERYIQQAFDQLMKNRTTLIIAHRLSTIENADKIITLNKGRIIEMGTHQRLLSSDGYYAKLRKMQFQQDKQPISQIDNVVA